LPSKVTGTHWHPPARVEDHLQNRRSTRRRLKGRSYKKKPGECGQRGVETDGRSNGDDKRITAGGRIMTRRMRRRDCVLVTVRRAARPVCQTNTDSAVGRGLHVGVSLTDVRYRTHLITLTNSFTVLLDYRPVELGEGGLLGR